MATDDAGDRGEDECRILLTNLCGRRQPFFRPRPLGAKYPAFDYIVELVDRPEYFFFVQVKATALGYTRRPRRLRVQLDQADVDRMVACPVPTYLVGIDVTAREVGFLLSVNEPRRRVASLTTRFPIDSGVLTELRDEVVAFRASRDMLLRGSRFRE